jgi:perosamine synthetase
MDVKNITVKKNDNLKFALAQIDQFGLGTLFVVSEDFSLEGVLTDGDIRRALIRGVGLNDSVYQIMNTDFLKLPVNSDTVEILNKLNDIIKIIPLVDNENKLVDYATSQKTRRIPVSSPLLNGNEINYVTDCIKTNWVSSQGKYVGLFEKIFSEYHQNRSTLAVSNGTVALHLALEALNIGPGDEVIVPNLTFAASVNAIIYTGACPVLVDVDPKTWNMDCAKISNLINEKTKAILPVHLYGLPCDMHSIIEIANKFNLYVIEDCAEALGSFYDGKPVGSFGDAATFSFFGNKTITTGEGGMVLFKDPERAAHAAVLRDHGMSKTKRYWHDFVGFNYRLTNIQAAIGVAQFERLDEFVNTKIKIANDYNELFTSLNYFEIPFIDSNIVNSYWLYTCLVKPNSPFTRNEIMDFLYQKGIETRPAFYPMSDMPIYAKFTQEDLEVSKDISARGISFPSSTGLSSLDLEYIKKMVKLFINKY